MDAGVEMVPVLVFVSLIGAVRPEATLGVKSEVDSGLGRLTVGPVGLGLRAMVGAGGRIFATRQSKKIPAIEVEPELSPGASFWRDGAREALGPIDDPFCTEVGAFSSARPRVEAKESSPVGGSLTMVEAGSVGATAPADWT
jgi:hypothetical protein